MKTPVIAIGLDAADPVLLENWMSQGHLKNISQIRQQGIYGRLNNFVNYNGVSTEFSATEPSWVAFLTGCLPNKTGYWDTIKYEASNYKTSCDIINGGYDYKEYPPFYALGDHYRVATFDVPVTTLSEQINGLQVLGWGGHFPFTPSHSLPSGLLPSLNDKYGKSTILHNDTGIWWDRHYIEWLQKELKQTINTRSAICRDLLKREDWDLFLTVFSETHSAGHDFWHLSQPDHPLYSYKKLRKGVAGDPILNAFEQVDQAIGDILAEIPDHAYVVLFSVHGMGVNITDMLSMTFLPEILYRYNFPGKVGLAPGKLGETPPPLRTNPIRKYWLGEVWRQKYEANTLKRFLKPLTPCRFLHSGPNDLISPYQLAQQQDDLAYMPARWYAPLWPQMKAFALPNFSDGHIRINLQGREPEGIVSPCEYDGLCTELTEMLYRLKDARTGELLVKDVVRTRHSPTENDPKLPDADLVVMWHDRPTDIVDSPDIGRIGPIIYYRPGGHRPRGFLMAKGPNIAPGSSLPEGQILDLAPTILELMGAPIPDYFDGKSLLPFFAAKSAVAI
ncbi:MAG: alkaline phosphatase family protein [Mojavia pulchra JT2-VF2]|jgi:predicted AlkP superfamily phosphohydrolase/phosphomutase|uniref:Alkaline phosphatase family protein n=1 Tax=Mojavia pulchra JT2-VF2 TaxID=287848 RepID=A0A951UJ74_9NOST|nr:alkaline phosphatase family protein [Mojavia pulchra JT2-VF2]